MRILLLLMLFTGFGYSGQAQSMILKGKVTDTKSGEPIAAASIMIKGTSKGTQADANGYFSLTVPHPKVLLVISAIGYTSKTIQADSLSLHNIGLDATVQTTSEVVVVGYGTKKRSSVTGAMATIPGQVLSGSPTAKSLQGQVSERFATEQYNFQHDMQPDRKWANKPLEDPGFDREGYDGIVENGFRKAKDNPLSTFSIDVDAASYSNMRRFIQDDELPPVGAIRIEELINYFSYDYPQPKAGLPFSVNTEMTVCPWNTAHRLVLIGLQGRIIPTKNLPPTNFVFLIDVSGSMSDEDKLPLVKQSLLLLVDQLRPQDKVSLCVYAGSAGLVLASTPGSDKQKIKDAIIELESGGSTAGGQGIKLAYATARAAFIKGGNNRVVLCTDGDFNVGLSSDDELERLIEQERKSGVFLTVLGFGTGNYQDAKMQKLADKGNGNHAYIDQLSEAKKVLVNEFGGTMFTIAKDVKLQIEFNPALVQGYRLIGYENRVLNNEDFNDDNKDAGELGSGHTVTALYEIIPAGIKTQMLKTVDRLKYQTEPKNDFPRSSFSNEMMTVKLRYKKPDGNKSQLLSYAVSDKVLPVAKGSENLRFAAAVASFGMLLRHSKYRQESGFDKVLELAQSAIGSDAQGYRKEFVTLVKQAAELAKNDKQFIKQALESVDNKTSSLRR